MKTYDIEELRKLIDYDPETGIHTWKERTAEYYSGNQRKANQFNSQYANKKAGGPTNTHPELVNGYWKTIVTLPNGERVNGHRLAWALYYGVWPTKTLDHINGDGLDNRIENLREVSFNENQRNRKMPVHNTSGCVGVYKSRTPNKWNARINHDNKFIYLGTFNSKEEAIEARKKAEKEYGYHENHGREIVNAESE